MAHNILIFTGNGKGKSTAAFGTAVRAAGHGHKILIVQFMKSDDSCGEIRSLRDRLEIDMRLTGLGFVPKADHPKYAAHRQAAQQGFSDACNDIHSGRYDLVILDEICGAVTAGLLEEEQVLNLLREPQRNLNLILTGRGATEAMIELADTVTEMLPHKHAMEQGIPARKGIEY